MAEVEGRPSRAVVPRPEVIEDAEWSEVEVKPVTKPDAEAQALRVVTLRTTLQSVVRLLERHPIQIWTTEHAAALKAAEKIVHILKLAPSTEARKHDDLASALDAQTT